MDVRQVAKLAHLEISDAEVKLYTPQMANIVEYVEQLKPKRTYFTHITHDVKHERDSKLLPDGVECAYDGLAVNDEL